MDNSTTYDILLLDDNPRDAELLVRAIRKQGIVNNVTLIRDGAEALDIIFCEADATRERPRPLRLILLDLKLPKVNGLEVLRAIKTEERTRSIPVVIVTSSQEDQDIRESYSLGANGYVVKPVNSDAFMHTMGTLSLYWLVINQPPM
jgi:two-component system response regulator